MFKINHKRVITATMLIILLIVYLFVGAIYSEWETKNVWYASYIFASLTTIFFIWALYEFISLKKIKQWHWSLKAIIFIFGLILLWMPISNYTYYEPYAIAYTWKTRISAFRSWMTLLAIIGLLLILFMLTYIYKNFNFNDVFYILFGLLYLSFAFRAINLFMLDKSYGWTSVVFLLLIVICNDTFAYLGGSWYGKHKLAPNISPKKTWEGALTGLVAALVFTIGFVIIIMEATTFVEPFRNFFTTTVNKKEWQYMIYIILVVFLSFVSQLGDLLFSAIKRKYNVKDFSNLLPGHGGILDRIDSFSAVLIVTFIFANINNLKYFLG